MLARSIVESAFADLAGARYQRADAARLVPKTPGLYAFYGDEDAWSGLALNPVFVGQPLYVGKAERSLNGRDVGTHIAAGKTGSSTVRRSLAALLVDRLELVAVPRNLERPDGRASYALEAAGDLRLSSWMDAHLTLATWVKPAGVDLDEVETAVLVRLRPPLNIKKVGEPRERLLRARARLATAARNWPRPSSSG